MTGPKTGGRSSLSAIFDSLEPSFFGIRGVVSTRFCIYCGKEKPESDFSLEHIFPDRLGGKLCSDLFKTRNVCERCNSLMGLFVDGSFIKSWFRTNYDASSAREYLDLNSPKSFEPLIYMGRLKSISIANNEVCELWLGPCGSLYYHFHATDEDRFKAYAGGNPISRKADRGRVYLFLTSENQLWYQLSLRSLLAAFGEAMRFAGNFGISNNPDGVVLPLDDIAVAHLALLQSLRNRQHDCEFSVQLGFEGRWLSKLAIGLGANILGSQFLSTPYANQLRSALWEQDPNKRAQIPVRGSGFFREQQDQTDQILGWPGAYTLRIHAVGECLVLTLHLSNQQSMHVVISDDARLWATPEFDTYRDGQVYVVLPLLGQFVGPIQMNDYLNHRLKTIIIPELAAIESKRVDPSTLPPCR
jgi:hypothetical protein